MELHKIMIRALFAFFFLLVMIRQGGKRSIRQARLLDMVLVLIVGDMIDDLLWGEVPASIFVIGIATLMLSHGSLLIAARRWPSLGQFLQGAPSLLMRDGTPLRAAMRRERISMQDLESFLRREGLEREDWPEVKSVMLDPGGRPQVILHEWAQPVDDSDREVLREVLR